MALYDVVLARGRVIDPETGLDAVRDVGLNGGTIAAISEADLTGSAASVVDCSGLVVAPGFIDLHSHGMKPFDAELQACDGVTTHLELEFGCWPVGAFYDAIAAVGSPINFGCSVGHIPTRVAALEQIELGFSADDPCCMLEQKVTGASSHTRVASDSELSTLIALLERGIVDGGIGIGAGIAYTPGSDHREVYRLQQCCARNGVALFIHTRGKHDVGLEDFHEVFTNAAVTGCSLHLCHVPPMICHVEAAGQGRAVAELSTILGMIRKLREVGVDITLEAYPYTAGMTNIDSMIFAGNMATVQSKFPNVKMPQAMQWLDTGEFLDEESFSKYRQQTIQSGTGGMVYVHSMTQELVDFAIPQPEMIIASDAIPFVDGQAHPRGAGCFCKVLREYVREKKALSLLQALRQMTLLPAQRLQDFCPDMARKGRVQVGADADITVFDPSTVRDCATWTEPALKSAGVVHVIVNGQSVVSNGIFQPGVPAGRPIRGGRGGGDRRATKRPRTTGLYASILEGQDSSFLASPTNSL